jgi:hypothetical protein
MVHCRDRRRWGCNSTPADRPPRSLKNISWPSSWPRRGYLSRRILSARRQ